MILDNLKTSESPDYDNVSRHLLQEMTGNNKILEHIKVIVCNLHNAHPTWVSFQGAGGAYKKDPTYRGFQFSSLYVRRITDFLHEHGYIEMNKGYPGSREWKSQLSRMRATPRLLDLLEHFNADPSTIYRDTSHVETVIVKGKKLKNGTRKVIKTPNTPAVRQMRTNLGLINHVLQSSRIELDIDLHELEELNDRLTADPSKYKNPVDFTSKTLYRAFVDGSLKLYGRFHGGWWEGIPEGTRARIFIDGMPTTELDYSFLHPCILYGLEEVPLPDGDLYIIPGYEGMRKFVKRFMLMSFNANSERSAIGAQRKKYKKDEARGKPPAPIPITTANMRPITDQLRKSHAPIAHHFFSGVGNRLMYIDSGTAEEVMLHFARKGIACLPVYDSFIVSAMHAEECWDVMRHAYSWRFGQEIPVDFIDPIPKILDGPKVLTPTKEWKEFQKAAYSSFS